MNEEKKEINAEFEIMLMELDFFLANPDTKTNLEMNELNEEKKVYCVFEEMLGSEWKSNWDALCRFGEILQELCDTNNLEIEVRVVTSWLPSLDQEDSWIGDLWEQAIDLFYQEKLIEEFKQFITKIPTLSRWDVMEAWENFLMTEGKPVTEFPTGEGFTNDWYLNQPDETEIK